MKTLFLWLSDITLKSHFHGKVTMFSLALEFSILIFSQTSSSPYYHPYFVLLSLSSPCPLASQKNHSLHFHLPKVLHMIKFLLFLHHFHLSSSISMAYHWPAKGHHLVLTLVVSPLAAQPASSSIILLLTLWHWNTCDVHDWLDNWQYNKLIICLI